MAKVRGDGKSKPGPKPDPEVAARRAEVFRLVEKGWTTRQIAEHQGRKVYQVDKDISRGAKAMMNDGDALVKRYIYMQLARLEAMWAALCKDATSPTSKRRDSAVREAVKLFERQSKLLGLDAREAAEIMQIRTGLNAGGSAIDKWLLESVQGGEDFDGDGITGEIVEEYEDGERPFDPAEAAADAAFMAGAAAAARPIDPAVLDDEPEIYDPDDDPARGVVEQESVPRAKNRRGRGD